MCAKHLSKEWTSRLWRNDQEAERPIGDVRQRSDLSVVSVLKRQTDAPIRQVPRAARKHMYDAALRRRQAFDSCTPHCRDLSKDVSIVQLAAGSDVVWGDIHESLFSCAARRLDTGRDTRPAGFSSLTYHPRLAASARSADCLRDPGDRHRVAMDKPLRQHAHADVVAPRVVAAAPPPPRPR